MIRILLLHIVLCILPILGAGKNTDVPENNTIFSDLLFNDISTASDIFSFHEKEPPTSTKGIKTIVLDAGHGGHDPGCSGKHSREKEITLGMVKKLGRLLEEKYPDLNIIYTRTTDVFVPLHERATIANRNNADVFISIHCNYVKRAAVEGTETYVMGLHRAEENLNVAKRENSAILLEEDYGENYEGYDPNSPEGHIILSMYQNAFLEQSIQLAHYIEDEFVKTAKRSSRGVKQAGFLVLRRTSMPSVLIESGFLSNQQEESYLLSDKGQEQMASCIQRAFGRYIKDLPDTATEVLAHSSGPSPHDMIRTEPVTKGSKPDSKTRYRVQLGASQSKSMHEKNAIWSKVPDLDIIQEDKLFKYLSGSFEDYQKALDHKQYMTDIGFKGCFVVAYRENKRVEIRHVISGQ